VFGHVERIHVVVVRRINKIDVSQIIKGRWRPDKL